MNKNTLKKALLVSLLALPLFGCNDKTPDKTSELQPTTGEVVDKHAAVSTLGKAMKASTSAAAISYNIESTKDFSFSVKENIHNSIENTDSEKSLNIVANTISADYRTTTVDDGNEDQRQSSLELTAGQLHYDTAGANGSVSRNRSNVKFASYIKDETYYIDPTNKELANTAYDLADYVGLGNYRTVISLIMANKYYASKADFESALEKTGYKDEIESWIDIFTSVSITNEIDEAIVEIDGKVDNWSWLTTYADANGDYTIYASLNKAEFLAFLDEMDPVEEGEERETYTEALANVNFTSLEFSVTFNESGLKGVGTVFALNGDKKDVDVYEETTLPFPGTDGIDTRKKVGYEDIHYEVSGGFKMTFGAEAPKEPGTSGWTDISEIVDKYLK